MNKKEQLLAAVHDAVFDLLVYDRRNDDELSEYDVDKLLRSGAVRPQDMTAVFSRTLHDALDQFGIKWGIISHTNIGESWYIEGKDGGMNDWTEDAALATQYKMTDAYKMHQSITSK